MKLAAPALLFVDFVAPGRARQCGRLAIIFKGGDPVPINGWLGSIPLYHYSVTESVRTNENECLVGRTASAADQIFRFF